LGLLHPDLCATPHYLAPGGSWNYN
jgi:hypothetical protein